VGVAYNGRRQRPGQLWAARGREKERLDPGPGHRKRTHPLTALMIVDVDSATKKQLVLIATCHVHWDPEFCDVKLIQTMMFMHRLQNIIKEAQTALLPPSSSSDCNQIPVILCGDLNSLPESGVLCLLIVFYYCATFNLSHCT